MERPCDLTTLICELVPSGQGPIAGGELGFADSSLTLTNADGTVDATNLDSLQLVPLDATTLAVTATATFRDGNSNPFRIAFVDLTLFDDGATLSVLDGSLSLTTP